MCSIVQDKKEGGHSKIKVKISDKVWLKITLMPSSSRELPLQIYFACSSMKIKGHLRVSFSVTHHICDRNGFCSIHFHSQAFGYSSPVSSVDSPAFPGQLDTELNDLKGMHIRCFPVGFLVTMLQDLLPAVQLFPGLFTWDHYVIIHFMESH